MKKIIQYIKEHRWAQIAIVILVKILLMGIIIGVPIGIHCIFDVPAPVEWLEAEWNREDVLSYYGDVLGFLGTVALSSLALWQNHIIKKESENREDLLRKMEYDKNMPILNWRNTSWSGSCGELKVTVENISENPANEVAVRDLVIKNQKGEIISESQKATPEFKGVAGREKVMFTFANKNSMEDVYKITFKLYYKDKFEKLHERIVFAKVNKKISSEEKYSSVEV